MASTSSFKTSHFNVREYGRGIDFCEKCDLSEGDTNVDVVGVRTEFLLHAKCLRDVVDVGRALCPARLVRYCAARDLRVDDDEVYGLLKHLFPGDAIERSDEYSEAHLAVDALEEELKDVREQLDLVHQYGNNQIQEDQWDETLARITSRLDVLTTILKRG